MQALNAIKSEIINATKQAARNINDITLVAVTKNKTIADVKEAMAAGQKDFGENYVQEAIQKIAALGSAPIQWHYLGKIQSNKIKEIVKYFDYVHSVDSLAHAEALSKECQKQNKIMPIFLQVNFENEVSKNGFSQQELNNQLINIKALPCLKLMGLMLIPSPKPMAEQREIFAKFRRYRDELQKEFNIDLKDLSMGMSDDFVAAILEGATYVRIGTRIFGKRNI